MFNLPAHTGEPRSFVKMIVYFSAILLVIWAFVLSQSDEKPMQAPTVESQARLDSLRALVGRDAITVATKDSKQDKSLMERGFPAFIALSILLFGAWFFLRRADKKQPLSQPFTVLASQDVSPGYQLKIVSFQNKLWVLGLSPQGMTLLKELEEGEWQPEANPVAMPQQGFAQWMERFQKKDDA